MPAVQPKNVEYVQIFMFLGSLNSIYWHRNNGKRYNPRAYTSPSSARLMQCCWMMRVCMYQINVRPCIVSLSPHRLIKMRKKSAEITSKNCAEKTIEQHWLPYATLRLKHFYNANLITFTEYVKRYGCAQGEREYGIPTALTHEIWQLRFTYLPSLRKIYCIINAETQRGRRALVCVPFNRHSLWSLHI